MIEILEQGIDVKRLQTEMEQLLTANNLRDKKQVSLTSVSGNDDWTCSIGRSSHLQKPEKSYCVVNKSLHGTYIEELLLKYKKFYRWRLLSVPPGDFYSVHSDAKDKGNLVNWRIHIPIITNSKAFFCYYGARPEDGVKTTVSFHHLKPGNVYKLNTSALHSAINYGNTPRYHIVGVKYEPFDNQESAIL